MKHLLALAFLALFSIQNAHSQAIEKFEYAKILFIKTALTESLSTLSAMVEQPPSKPIKVDEEDNLRLANGGAVLLKSITDGLNILGETGWEVIEFGDTYTEKTDIFASIKQEIYFKRRLTSNNK